MQFRSNGKLLITGEYLILDGALGLSLPTRFGQSMNVSKESRASIKWTSFDSKNSPWFSAEYDNDIKTIIDCTDVGIAEELKHLFHAAKELSPLFNPAGCKVQCKLDFPRNWGLGSSSTLRINMSKWANISPFELHMATSNGSGYDIAAGMSNEPILFSNQTEFNSTPVSFSPKFIKHLFFIHLNKKQKSTDEVVSENIWETIEVESTNNDLLPFLLTIPLQKLAYYSALKKGYDIDKPRNLAKSVTVE